MSEDIKNTEIEDVSMTCEGEVNCSAYKDYVITLSRDEKVSSVTLDDEPVEFVQEGTSVTLDTGKMETAIIAYEDKLKAAFREKEKAKEEGKEVPADSDKEVDPKAYLKVTLSSGKELTAALSVVVVDVNNLAIGFVVRGKKTHVIRNISFKVYRGETLAIVGESGSGKSVTTKAFTGMLDSNSIIYNGSIMFHNVDLAKLKTSKEWQPYRGKRLATIFQDPMTSLNPLLKIGYQISEVLRLHHGLSKEEAKKEAIKLLKRVRIPNAEDRYNDYPFQYSGGMRQRVVIAIALACRPEILICDEPTTALDVTVQAQIIALIKELQKEYHWTTIFITHDLGVVANVADRIAVMYGGQIIEYGTVEDVFYDPQHPYTWALLSSLPQLGSKDEPLSFIRGNPPTFSTEIIGDAFAARSNYAMNIDFVKEPPVFQVSPTHWAKTWLLDPRAPKVEKPKVVTELHERMKRSASELKRQEGED